MLTESLHLKPEYFAIKQQWEEAVYNEEKTVEGRINKDKAATVKAGDRILLGSTMVLVQSVHHYDSFKDMLNKEGVDACLPGVADVRSGVHIYHKFKNYGPEAARHGVVAWRIQTVKSDKIIAYAEFNWEQRQFVDELRKAIEHAFAVRDASDDFQGQQLIDASHHKVQALFGPPGTGKTVATLFVVDEVLEAGGHVLFTMYTAQAASRIRERFANHPHVRNLRIETCHAAFGLDDDFVEMPLLSGYQLVVVDEVSQLSGEQNDKILKLRDVVDGVFALAELGDRHQMAGFGNTRPWDTRLWGQCVFRTNLWQPYRCLDQKYQNILDIIRVGTPGGAEWAMIQHDFLRYNKAWGSKERQEPARDDIAKLLQEWPEAPMLAFSRNGMMLLNDLALE
eukprot:12413846-Karenia_brevis.AAC.1